MFQQLPTQKLISIYLVKIQEVKMAAGYSDEDRATIISFYRKKIRSLRAA
jgi:hypothetical protein